MHKTRLDELVSKNYIHLKTIAGNIAGRCANKRDVAHNLLHDIIAKMYEELEEKNTHLSSEQDFLRFTVKSMHQYYNREKSRKYRRRKDNLLFTWHPRYDELDKNTTIYVDNITDNRAEEKVYIQSEDVDDLTKLFLMDLVINEIPTEKFTGVEREIFDLFYLQQIDCKRIFTELRRTNNKSMSYENIREIQKRVKQKIIDTINGMLFHNEEQPSSSAEQDIGERLDDMVLGLS